MSRVGHIDSIVNEKDILYNISCSGLLNIGYSVYQARTRVRLSTLLWNIIDSWYRSRLYRGSTREDIIGSLKEE